MNIEFNEDLTVNDEQAETIAFNIYNSIDSYIKEHELDFLEWKIDLICSENNIVITLKGVIKCNSYKYKICDYERNN